MAINALLYSSNLVNTASLHVCQKNQALEILKDYQTNSFILNQGNLFHFYRIKQNFVFLKQLLIHSIFPGKNLLFHDLDSTAIILYMYHLSHCKVRLAGFLCSKKLESDQSRDCKTIVRRVYNHLLHNIQPVFIDSYVC